MKFYKTALYIAVEKEYYEIIKLLLENKKLDVNIPAKFETQKYFETFEKYKTESTPLHNAIKNRNVRIIELLLQKENVIIDLFDLPILFIYALPSKELYLSKMILILFLILLFFTICL